MSTTAEIQAATALTVRELTKAGIKVRAYAKNPLSGGNATFSIALDPKNELRIWNGEAKVTVVPSTERALKQVVLQVHEKGRTITKVHKLEWQDWDRATTLKAFREFRATDWWIQRHLGVTLPLGAVYSITALNRVEKPQSNPTGQDDYGTVTLQGRVKTTNQSFLIGRDEKSQFISALPRQCRSVVDAHDALRPSSVPKDAPRQGEWFFVPATIAERKLIEASIKARGSAGIIARDTWSRNDNIQRNRVGQLEPRSSHRAPCSIIIKSKRYACGLVYDTRPDRHGSLMLGGWHRVIRNREVTSSATQNTARFD
jgi:hypothetical protein